MSRRRNRSTIATTVAAVRRARRRHSTRALGVPTLRESLELAVRDAQPRTVKGLAAQGTALAAIAGARNGGQLAPVLGLAATLPAELLVPGPTAAALAVAGAAGAIAHHRAGRAGVLIGWRGRQLGVAAGAGGALLFTGTVQAGLLTGMAFWQQLAVLGATWAPGAIAWWKPRPDLPDVPAIEGPAQPALPAEMDVLRAILTEATGRERSPVVGGRIVSLDHPAPQVATAIVEVPGSHVRQIPLSVLRDGLEAMADAAGQDHPGLGPLQPGAVEITTTGVSRIQVTVSWSRHLATSALPYTPPSDLAPGMVWLGRTEDRQDIAIPAWTRGVDAKVSVYHMKVIGATGSGKSFTTRTLLYGGLATATELVIPLDGKGDSLDELAALVPGGRVARDADAWQAGIELWGAILLSRKRRQGSTDAWDGARPGDPLVTLVVDEAAAVRLGLAPLHHGIVELGGRQGRSLGMRVIQASQVPLVDEWVGGGAWRAQASISLLHTLRDETHARIAAQGLDQVLDLTRMPRNFTAVAFDASVVAGRTRVATITPDDIRAITTAATLHPLDELMAAPAWDAYIQAVTQGSPGAGDSDPLVIALTELGTPGFGADPQATTTHTTTTTAEAGPVPAQTRTDVTDVHQTPQPAKATGSLRQTILTRLLTTSVLPSRPELVAELIAAGWSKSGAHKAIGQMLTEGALIEEAGRIAPAILA
jgi:hypothetical protein